MKKRVQVIMKCSVCDSDVVKGMTECAKCGYDCTTDYTYFPSVQILTEKDIDQYTKKNKDHYSTYLVKNSNLANNQIAVDTKSGRLDMDMDLYKLKSDKFELTKRVYFTIGTFLYLVMVVLQCVYIFNNNNNVFSSIIYSIIGIIALFGIVLVNLDDNVYEIFNSFFENLMEFFLLNTWLFVVIIFLAYRYIRPELLLLIGYSITDMSLVIYLNLFILLNGIFKMFGLNKFLEYIQLLVLIALTFMIFGLIYFDYFY